jgi:hypothetical protein
VGVPVPEIHFDVRDIEHKLFISDSVKQITIDFLMLAATPSASRKRRYLLMAMSLFLSFRRTEAS